MSFNSIHTAVQRSMKWRSKEEVISSIKVCAETQCVFKIVKDLFVVALALRKYGG